MIFDRLVRLFIVVLPFHVILSVFLQFKVDIPNISIYKEVLLLVLVIFLGYKYFQKKEWPKWDWIDGLTFAYCGYMLFISLLEGVGLRAIFFGARYDMEFLAAFLLAKHIKPFLLKPLSYYIRLFLISGGIALFLGMLVRFVFHETVLLNFGFSPDLSTWNVNGSVPIYHGIEGASVRRFQGIFDGPNQAALFLLGYIGLFVHYFKTKKDFWFWTGCVAFILLGLLFLTYSRSALLGAFAGFAFVFLKNGVYLWKKHRQIIATSLLILCLTAGLMYLKYGANIQNIVLRAGSSKGHYERMAEGINQAKEKPFGYGLASSGPAFRHAYPNSTKEEKEYIPESWYIQQLVEGGWIGLGLFVALMGGIMWILMQMSSIYAAAFLATLCMNVVLHAYESSYVSLLIFFFCGLFLAYKKENKN